MLQHGLVAVMSVSPARIGQNEEGQAGEAFPSKTATNPLRRATLPELPQHRQAHQGDEPGTMSTKFPREDSSSLRVVRSAELGARARGSSDDVRESDAELEKAVVFFAAQTPRHEPGLPQ